MAIANWSFPTNIKFGCGRISETGMACEELGILRPLIVTDKNLAESQITINLQDSLSKSDLKVNTFSEVDSNPNEKNLETGLNYLKDISNIIKKNTGGLLLIDYGYTDKKMKNTLQAVSNHKFANILSNIGNVDITHNINFNIFEKFVKQMNGLKTNLTSQKDFLTKLGIKERAEIISKNKNFTKKSDIYYRLERLINKKQMGHLFKVMLIKNENNKFKLGF